MTAPDLNLEALREVVEAATDLPWRIGNRADLVVRWDTETPLATVEPIATMVSGHGFRRWKEDAALIVAAVNALPVLMDEVQRLRRWKSEALEVLKGWEGVHEALDHPGELGQMKYKASVAAVHALTADRDRLREEVRAQIVARDGQHDRRVIAETERDIALARVTELENGIRGLVQVRHDEDPAPFYAAFRRLTALLPADTEKAEAEVARLTQWKSEAMEVLNGWDRVYDALGCPGQIGDQTFEAALSEVARLTAVVQGVRELAAGWERNAKSDRIESQATASNVLGRHYWEGCEDTHKDCAVDLRDVLAGGTDTPKGEGG